jgi:hypothetical protein
MTEKFIYRNWLIWDSQMINVIEIYAIEIEIKIANHFSKTWKQIQELNNAMEYMQQSPKDNIKG